MVIQGEYTMANNLTEAKLVPEVNPLYAIKYESENMGKRYLLNNLINSAKRVGATVVTVESLEKILEDIER